MDASSEHALLVSLTTAISGGVALTILARWLRLPAIVLLLAGGVLLGPEGLGWIRPEGLEGMLPVIVALAVGIILFEGGLTLDLRGYARGSRTIVHLLSIGVVVTWLGTAFFVWAIFDTSPGFAILAGSLVIVTGPTVIGPLLQRIQIIPRLHTILHWEGVLIDAIGVFMAVLCFEWLVGKSGGEALAKFGFRVFSGLLLGAVGGLAIVAVFRRKWVPESLVNAFSLGAAVLIFGVTESLISEAGLLSVTLAGLIVGWHRPVELRQIRKFKGELTDLLIGLLFLLLTARLRFEQFHDFGWRGVALVVCVIAVVRPLNIWLSTLGSGLAWRERLFLAWVAPRGIVAASMASLFALALREHAVDGEPRFLETFVYSVVVATVVLQGFTAGPVARLLGLRRPDPTGWLLVNADAFSRRLGRFIQDEAQLSVLLLDTNARRVAEAAEAGLPALCEDALEVEATEERPEFQRAGHLLALTDNSDLNELLCRRWRRSMGAERVYRWASARLHAAGGVKEWPPAVFPKVARPSVLAAELANGEAQMETITYSEPMPDFEGTPLLAARPGAVLLYREAAAFRSALRPGDRVLLLRRTAGFLARSVEAVLEPRGQTLEAVYEEALAWLVARHPRLSREDALAQLAAVGDGLPTQLGHGVAIPHIYSRHLRKRVVLLLRLPGGGLAAPGAEEPLRLLFFVVSPAGDPEGHLATLAEIARQVADPVGLQRLLADPADAVLRRMQEEAT